MACAIPKRAGIKLEDVAARCREAASTVSGNASNKCILDIFPPQEGPQTEFVNSTAQITVIGGSAGGGKTWIELANHTRYTGNSGYNAVIFRRTMKQVKDEGGVWDASMELYPSCGAKPNLTERYWTFPSGASVSFAGLEREDNKFDWKSAEVCHIAFEELTEFTSGQFFYLLSRNRSTCGVPPQITATTNPKPGWVKVLLAPWVDRTFPKPARSGEVRWFLRKHNQIIWLDEQPQREICDKGAGGKKCLKEDCENCFPPEKSITFIRAKVFDNRILLEANPEYVANLRALDEVERKRLLDGDWDAKPPFLVIDAFDETKDVVRSDFAIGEKWRRYVGMDFGKINSACVVLAEDPHNGRLYLIDEDWPGHDRPYEDWGNAIRKMCGGTPVRGAGGNRTTEQGWRQAWRKEGIPMEEPEQAHADPGLQFKCVNDAFRDGSLVVLEKCSKTIGMLGSFTHIIGDDGLPTDKFDDSTFHLLSALRYVITKLRPPRVPQSKALGLSPALRIASVPRKTS